MPHLDTCLGILRRLIAKGDPNGIPLAERAIDEYWDVTPAKARKSGLRFLQQDVLTQHNAVVGVQRSFAETVNAYIEKKLDVSKKWSVLTSMPGGCVENCSFNGVYR
jgi:hypothetical protein